MSIGFDYSKYSNTVTLTFALNSGKLIYLHNCTLLFVLPFLLLLHANFKSLIFEESDAAAERFYNHAFLQCLKCFDWIIRWFVAIWSFNCTKEKDRWVLEFRTKILQARIMLWACSTIVAFLHFRSRWAEKEEDQVWYRFCTIFCCIYEESTWPSCKPERRAGFNFTFI